MLKKIAICVRAILIWYSIPIFVFTFVFFLLFLAVSNQGANKTIEKLISLVGGIMLLRKYYKKYLACQKKKNGKILLRIDLIGLVQFF